jgi:hypothetical protein
MVFGLRAEAKFSLTSGYFNTGQMAWALDRHSRWFSLSLYDSHGRGLHTHHGVVWSIAVSISIYGFTYSSRGILGRSYTFVGDITRAVVWW